jgi:hypothetical protein
LAKIINATKLKNVFFQIRYWPEAGIIAMNWHTPLFSGPLRAFPLTRKCGLQDNSWAYIWHLP